MHLTKCRTLLVLTLLLALLFTACSRNKQETRADSILDLAVMQELPADTFAFYVWDNTRPPAERVRKSDFAQAQQRIFVSSLESAGGKQGFDKAVASIAGALRKAKLLDGPGENHAAIEKGVLFAELDEGPAKMAAAAYMQLKANFDTTVALKQLREALEQEGAAVSDLALEGAGGFTVAVPKGDQGGKTGSAADDPTQPSEILVAAKGSRLAVGTTKQQLTRFLSSAQEGGFKSLRESAAFKRTLAALPTGPDQLAYGFLNPAVLIEQLNSTMPKNVVPFGEGLKELPFDGVAFSHGMDENIFAQLVLPLSAKTEEQKGVFGRLSKAAGANPLLRVPADTVAVVNFSGTLLGELVDGVERSEQVPPPVKEYVKKFAGTGSFMVAVRDNPAGNFPDLAIVLEGESAPAVRALVKEQLGAAMGGAEGSPFGGGGWLQKEIDGNNVDFIMLPLVGIGAYLAEVQGSLIIATSEPMVKDSIAAIESGKAGVFAKLSKDAQGVVAGRNPLYTQFLDFPAVGRTAKRLSQTLSMFTGGQPAFDTNQFEAYEKMGLSVIGLELKDDVLRLEGRYSQPAKK